MGDNLDNDTSGMPLNNFFMDRFEVTRELWESVKTWGNGHGYGIGGGGYKGPGHPVHSMTWYDAVKWCNARSEKDGRTPCYYTDTAQTTASIYKTGSTNITNAMVKWNADGYRLPTEAEWRNLMLFFRAKAARSKMGARPDGSTPPAPEKAKREVSPLRFARLSACASVEMTGFILLRQSGGAAGAALP